MKTKKLSIIVASVIFLAAGQAWTTTIAFYSDGVIQNGDEYSYVSVYNDAIVDMTGGTVTIQLGAYDSSTVNISGGVLNGVFTSGESVDSTLNLSGSMQADEVEIWGSGTLNMLGGTIGSVEIHNVANLYGGTISDYLLATSTVNIYGYDFEYDPLAGNYQGGQLTGFWLDDTPFSIDLYYQDIPGAPIIDTWSHIVLIPEPTTILLLAIGGIILRKRD